MTRARWQSTIGLSLWCVAAHGLERPRDIAAERRNALLAAPTRAAQAELVHGYVEVAHAAAAPELSLLMGKVFGSADSADAQLHEVVCEEARQLSELGAEAFYAVAASPRTDAETRTGAIASLRCIGQPAIPWLVAGLELDVDSSGLAASMLADLARPFMTAVQPTESALRKLLALRRSKTVGQDCDPTASVALGYFDLYRSLAKVPAAELVLESLSDKCSWIRKGALSLLEFEPRWYCQTKTAVLALAENDPSLEVRRAAELALRPGACRE